MIVEREARAAEQAKYADAYAREEYRMGGERMQAARHDLAALPRGSYLDIGCGRGEMVHFAQSIGFKPCLGVEVVPYLLGENVIAGEAHALPVAAKSFDVVSLLDVIEHLLPGDDEAACREIARVASKHALLTANNYSSKTPEGIELHVNRRPYAEWDGLFRQWFEGARVTWLRVDAMLRLNRGQLASQTWRIDF